MSMTIIQRMSAMALPLTKRIHSKSVCHCNKNPRRQQEHLDGVMLLVAWYVGLLRAFLWEGFWNLVIAAVTGFFQERQHLA